MKILAIETSCDETAAAVIEDGTKILSNVVVSQIDIFAAYGGVIPEVAARSHLEAILPVIHQTLNDANLDKNDLDAIAVTHTPGLMGSLMIGTLTARMLAILWEKPLYPVHHLKSHIYANWLNIRENNEGEEKKQGLSEISSERIRSYSEDERVSPATAGANDVPLRRASRLAPNFPLLSLVISGGHTQILYMPSHNHFKIIGTTRDDAVGECFDKVAKILGLPYPGGPAIAACAKNGNPKKYPLPHPKVDGLDFSFSGLKTAVLRAIQSACGLPISTPSYELKNHLTDEMCADFAASFQNTACDILLEKLQFALKAHPEALSLVFAGGVSANHLLREKALHAPLNGLKTQNNHKHHAENSLKSAQIASDVPKSPENHLSSYSTVYFPDPKFTGDNAAMVGAAAYFEIQSGVQPVDPYSLDIAPRTPLS